MMTSCVLKEGIFRGAAGLASPESLEHLKRSSTTALDRLKERNTDIVNRINRLREARSFDDSMRLCLETRRDGMAAYDALLFADDRELATKLVRQLNQSLSEARTLACQVATELVSKCKELLNSVDPTNCEQVKELRVLFQNCELAEFYSRNVEFRSKLVSALANERYDDFLSLLRSATAFSRPSRTADVQPLETIADPAQRLFVHQLVAGLQARIEYIAAEVGMEHGPYPDCLEIHRQLAEFAVQQFEMAMTNGLVPLSYHSRIDHVLKAVKDDVIAILDRDRFVNSCETTGLADLSAISSNEIWEFPYDPTKGPSILSRILRSPLQNIRLNLIHLSDQTEVEGDVSGPSLDPQVTLTSVPKNLDVVDNFEPIMTVLKELLDDLRKQLSPLSVLIYRVASPELTEWCASCLEYGIAAWDQDPSEALLKLCDKIEVEESIRRDGLQVQCIEGIRDIRPEQLAAPEAVSGDVADAFASSGSEEFDLKAFSRDSLNFVENCSLRGLRIRKTDQAFPV